MEGAFVNLTPENLDQEHLCCIIRSKKPHPGVEVKRQWLSGRLKEGHVFRKLDAKATVFIEYGVRPPGDGLGPHSGGQLPLHLLPVGAWRREGEGVRPGADGVLSLRRPGKGQVRGVHAGGGQVEGLALRPVLRPKIRI